MLMAMQSDDQKDLSGSSIDDILYEPSPILLVYKECLLSLQAFGFSSNSMGKNPATPKIHCLKILIHYLVNVRTKYTLWGT